MENRRSPWTGVAVDEAAQSDRPSASQYRGAALRSACVVCDYKLKAGGNARAIIVGSENRGAELAGCDVGRAAEVAAFHFNRGRGVFHLSCHEVTFCLVLRWELSGREHGSIVRRLVLSARIPATWFPAPRAYS